MLALALLIAAFMAVIYPFVMVGAPNGRDIRIPRNASSENVRDSLTKEFGEDYAGKVMRLVSMRKTDFKTRHGLYHIEKGSNALSAMRKLTSGGETPVRLTINGFRSFPLLVDKISAKFDFPADSLWSVLSDKEFMASFGVTPEQAMAIFLNNTYEVYWSASAREAVEKIGGNYKLLWGETNRRKAAALGLTPSEVTVLSTIVDEETNSESEKPIIGRLYINRLKKGMRLQADPTVKFAVNDFTLRRITAKHLKVESPYNTYLNFGLPPGPIRTPDETTIRAILNSDPNDYLYMCAKDDFSGRHNFSTSYSEHMQNALRYRHALDRNDIH